jgi:hypothetical protein
LEKLLETNGKGNSDDGEGRPFWVFIWIYPTHIWFFFTFGCCILLRIYPTGSIWCRQSQQSFNTSTPPFYFSSHSLHVSATTGHLQVRNTIRCFQGLFLLQRICCKYTTWHIDVICLYRNFDPWSPIYVIKLSIKVVKTLKFTVKTGLIYMM